MGNPVVVDMFCGAGGESVGIKAAMPNIELHAINHWERAIETHAANFPEAEHHCESIEKLDPVKVVAGQRVALLWASPECTHHSNARGGRPCSDQSRSSAWLVLKWMQELYAERVIIENVQEFKSWGPLGANGRPLKSKRGQTYQAFLQAIRSLGYRVDARVLCAADYGTPTTRKRLFIQAVRGRKKIVWPTPTHSKSPGMFAEQRWIPAKDIIDWSISGESIFTRKRPLADATIRRIEAGIRKYWGEWAEPFLVILRGTGTSRSIDRPLPAVTAGGQHVGLAEPFVTIHRGQSVSRRIGAPLPTVSSGGGHFGVIEPFMLQLTHGGRVKGLENPTPTITCAKRGEIGLIEPFILHQMTPGRPRSVSEPLPTITTIRGHKLVQPFLVKYNGTDRDRSIDKPLDTVMTKDRFALVDGVPAQLDIRFRMLQPHELAAAQGFPRDYIMTGNKTEQVRQIGNAVPCPLAQALVAS